MPPIDLQRKRDVVVVGSGPAGAGAAFFFARRGLDVLLLEAKPLPRVKPCGEGMGPRTVRMLNRMGLENWLKTGSPYRVERMRITAPFGATITSTTKSERFPISHGYVIKRDELDFKLVNQAREAGAELLERFHVNYLLGADGPIQYFNGSRITGVTGIFEGNTQTIKARLTVVADGSTGLLSRHFNGLKNKVQTIGLRAYAENVEGIDDCCNIFFSDRFPGSYGWIFPNSPTTANVGVGLLGIEKGRAGRLIYEAYNFFIDKQCLKPLSLRHCAISAKPVGSIMNMNFGKRCIQKPGVGFVGDAAGLVSPLSGEGVCHALESSELLAEIPANSFKSENALDKALRAYDRELRHRFRAYFRWSRWLSRLLAHPRRLDQVIRRAQKDDFLRIILTNILTNTGRPQELAQLKVIKKLLF